MGEDISADLLLLPLDQVDISEHAVRLVSLG